MFKKKVPSQSFSSWRINKAGYSVMIKWRRWFFFYFLFNLFFATAGVLVKKKKLICWMIIYFVVMTDANTIRSQKDELRLSQHVECKWHLRPKAKYESHCNEGTTVYFLHEMWAFWSQLWVNNISGDLAGQFICAVQLGGGTRFWHNGEVPRTGRPVHQRGLDPAFRCCFSEGWTLVPYGFSLNI